MKIGCIGTGAIGEGMAIHLLRAGHELWCVANRDRTPIERLLSRGAREAAALGELVDAVDLILLCLPSSEVVARVIDEAAPSLRPGQIVIDAGTSALDDTQAVATKLGALGVRFAEAPVAGGAKQSQEGVLGAMVGCDEHLLPTIEPILQCFCATVQRFGPVGAGGRAKLVGNFLVFGAVAAILEGFIAARAAGVDWARLYDVAIRGAGDSGALRRIIGGCIEGDFKGYVFTVRGAHKDMRYITAMNVKLGLATPLNNAILEIFARAEAEGYGDLTLSELLRPDILAERYPLGEN